MRTTIRLLALVIGVAVPSACASAGAVPAASEIPPAGEFTGVLDFEDRPLSVRLRLQPDADDIRSTAVLNGRMLGLGTGTWAAPVLYVGLSYGAAEANGCTGRILIQARVVDRGERLEGTARASDCTGHATGAVRLELSARDPGHTDPRALTVGSGSR